MQEDAILVNQTLAGDEQAFHRLIVKYQSAIYRLILSYVRNPDDAQELTQEVFLETYRDLVSLRQPEQFQFWLRQIARHQCQDWKRKRQVELSELQDNIIAESPDLDELLILRETLAKVMQAIDELPETEKELMKSHYLNDVSYSDLQAKHGLSSKALVMRLLRAREKIRQRVEKLLAGIGIFSWHDALKKMLLIGVETMKISVKTKLIVAVIAILMISSGTGVILWNYQSKQEKLDSIVSQTDQKVTITPSKDLLSDSNSSNKHTVTQLVSQTTANQDQKGDQFKKTVAGPNIIGGNTQEATESKETPAELLQRYLKVTNSPEFIKKFHEKIDPLESETYPDYNKIKELEAKEKELTDKINSDFGENRIENQNELDKIKSSLWNTRLDHSEKVILLADEIHKLTLEYFSNKEYQIAMEEMRRTMPPPPSLNISSEVIERTLRIKAEVMARLKARGWVPANPDESWY